MLNKMSDKWCHPRGQERGRVEVLIDRAKLLRPEDRVLVEQVYVNHARPVDLAQLQGVDRRVLERRLKRLLERVTSEEFLFVHSHLSSFDPAMKKVAKRVFLQGYSLRETATMTGMGLTRVRRLKDALQTLVKV